MLDRRYHNARANDCSIPQAVAGPMTVHYQGGDYAVVGVYFTARSGRHEICYVLRPTLPSDEDLASAESGRTSQPGLPTRTEGGEIAIYGRRGT